MSNNIILVGNPNTGKTTLFNTLTKSNQKASNWHGVTVGTITKSFKWQGSEYSVTDLPGMYSVNGYSNEEKIANKYLENNKNDLVVNICDANNLERNLLLTTELIKKGYRVILAINMYKEVKHDYNALAKILNVPIALIDARKNKGVYELKSLIYKAFNTENNNEKLKPVLNSNLHNNLINLNPSIVFNKIKANDANNYKLNNKIDKFLLNKIIFLPVFVALIFAIFYITFGPVGEMLLSGFEWLMSKIMNGISSFLLGINMNPAVRSFLIDGLLNATVTVLSFVPQIVLLMFFLNLLEDTGFMSRLAFMFDGVMKKIGLTGKSLFSLMMGFGCTTSAVITTRNLENQNLRKRTALLLPFMTCTAKLPIFLVISSLFFESYKFLFVFMLYIFAVLVSVVFAFVYKKYIPEKQDVLILEMPKYRLPNLTKILKDTMTVIAEFLIKVGTLILFFTSIIWILQNFSCSFVFLNGSNFEQSILYFICSKLTSVFRFIGINSAGAVAAIVFGLVAKEMVVVGLCMFNGTVGSLELLSQSLMSPLSPCYFTPISSVVFLVFVLLYSPCISAIGAIKSEFGTKTALYVFFSQFVLSFAICFIIYHALINSIFAILLTVLVILAITANFVLKFIRKKNLCWGNCSACRKICSNKKTKTM